MKALSTGITKRSGTHIAGLAMGLVCVLTVPAYTLLAQQLDVPSPPSQSATTGHAIRVEDAIQAAVIGSDGYFKYNQRTNSKYNLAIFSPNGEHFVLVTQKGNLKANTNDYSLLLFDTQAAIRSPPGKPRVLVALSSSSNRPAIHEVQWLDDRRLAFVGEWPGELQQLYTIDSETGHLVKLTNHKTNLVSYAISSTLDHWFFAERAVKSLLDGGIARQGIVVSNQLLPDLVTLENHAGAEFGFEFFAERAGSRQEISLSTHGFAAYADLWLSPDGRYLVLKTLLRGPPSKGWSHYQNLASLSQNHRKFSSSSGDWRPGSALINEFELLDTNAEQSTPLVDAPIDVFGDFYAGVAWAPDSHSVIVTGTYLPLDVSNPIEREHRESRRYAAEVTVPNREVVPISDEEIKVIKWDRFTGKVLFETRRGGYRVVSDEQASVVGYRKEDRQWKKVDASAGELNESRRLQTFLDEDMNTPPRVISKEIATGRESVLLDLNPEFRHMTFGRVEEITFALPNGRSQRAGLYLPPGYLPDRRYPLVIQTHGWNPSRFRIDGPYTTAFAAQPLAGAGIVVVQLAEELNHLGTPAEVREMSAAFDGVINFLDGKQLIDPYRVGIIGFSRTGLGVEYALTHSQRRLAAATLADCNDAGYFLYLTVLNMIPYIVTDYEGLNGGAPFGKGLRIWERNSPDFNLDKVHSPVRLETNAPASLFSVWEWFAGLSRLEKPVDLIYMPNAAHVLVKPWDRLISQQGNVDWFRFWLQGYEDQDPVKSEQYRRWEQLCDMQRVGNPAHAAFCVSSRRSPVQQR